MRRFVPAAVGAALLMSFAAPAQADSTVSFTGLILDSCTLTLGTAGLLAADDEGSTLSSTAPGGLAAAATIIATSANYELEVDPVTNFALAPAGGQPDSATVTYSVQGVSTGSGILAGTPLDLGLGVSLVSLDTEAHKADGVFPAGAYRMDVVMRCAPA